MFYQQPICEPCASDLIKCQGCKQRESEIVIKDGSNDVNLCEKCYYCSKCKNRQAVARRVVDKFVEQKVIYEGSACEACIKELIREFNKCEECKTNSAIKPDGSIRTKQKGQQKIKVCESCHIKKEPTTKSGNYVRKVARAGRGVPDTIAVKERMEYLTKKCEKGTMTCHYCHKELTHGFMTWTEIFYCEKCARDRDITGNEFKVWIEEVKKQEPSQEQPKPNPGQSTSQPPPSQPKNNNQTLTTLKQIKVYLIVNNIQSIIQQPNGNLSITFNSSNKSTLPNQTNNGISNKTMVITNKQISDEANSDLNAEQRKMWQNLKDYLEKEGKKSLNETELDQAIRQLEANASTNQTQSPKKNYWPLAIGVGLVTIGVIAGLVYYFWNRKKPSE